MFQRTVRLSDRPAKQTAETTMFRPSRQPAWIKKREVEFDFPPCTRLRDRALHDAQLGETLVRQGFHSVSLPHTELKGTVQNETALDTAVRDTAQQRGVNGRDSLRFPCPIPDKALEQDASRHATAGSDGGPVDLRPGRNSTMHRVTIRYGAQLERQGFLAVSLPFAERRAASLDVTRQCCAVRREASLL